MNIWEQSAQAIAWMSVGIAFGYALTATITKDVAADACRTACPTTHAQVVASGDDKICMCGTKSLGVFVLKLEQP